MMLDRMDAKKKEPASNPYRKFLQVLAYLVAEEMDKSRTHEKQKLAVNSLGRGMPVS